MVSLAVQWLPPARLIVPSSGLIATRESNAKWAQHTLLHVLPWFQELQFRNSLIATCVPCLLSEDKYITHCCTVHTHTYTPTPTHMHTHTYKHTQTHMHTHAYTHKHTCTHTHTHTNTHAHTHTYTHTHTHTWLTCITTATGEMIEVSNNCNIAICI